MSDNENSDGYLKVKIIRGSVDSLALYEITDYELEIFEKGGPSSTYFNISVALLSVGLSFMSTIMTVDIVNIKTYTLFLLLSLVGIVGGAVNLVLWLKTRSPTKHICEKIRARVPTLPLPSPGTQEILAPLVVPDPNHTES